MRRDDENDAIVAVILLRRFQQQGDVLDLDARHLDAVMLPEEAADLGRHLEAERVLRHSALELFVRRILRLDPLEEGREVQAEGVEEAVVIARIHALLHVERHLLREVDERGVDDLQQALARRHVDRSFLVVEIAHVDIDIRREDLLDEVAADAFSLEELDFRLDDLVEIELRAAHAVRQREIRPRRHDDARVAAESFRDLRQGLAVGRERQEAAPDLLRQHLEIDLDALRAVNAVEEGLRAEQLDVRLELAGIAAADAADESLYCLDAHADRLLDALRLILEHQLDDVELLVRAALRERRYLHDVRDAAHEGLRQRGVGVLRRRPDDQDFGPAAALRLAEPVERARIHEVKNHFLPFRRQPVDLVEKEDPAVCLLDKSRF